MQLKILSKVFTESPSTSSRSLDVSLDGLLFLHLRYLIDWDASVSVYLPIPLSFYVGLKCHVLVADIEFPCIVFNKKFL